MTSFSRSSAPPRPLSRFASGSTSSAPSKDQSGRRVASEPTATPRVPQVSATSSDVGTAVHEKPSARARSARATTVRWLVVPEPTPTTSPGRNRAAIWAAAARFAASLVTPGPQSWSSSNATSKEPTSPPPRRAERRRRSYRSPVVTPGAASVAGWAGGEAQRGTPPLPQGSRRAGGPHRPPRRPAVGPPGPRGVVHPQGGGGAGGRRRRDRGPGVPRGARPPASRGRLDR